MSKKIHHFTKRVFVISFSILIVIFSISPAFAEESAPIQLSKANVLELPTASGEMYYSQKINDYITLSGGIVTTDGTGNGTIIPGEWTFTDPDARPSVSEYAYTSITFVPDDQEAYTGFSMTSIDVYFCVKKAPMAFADSNVQLTTQTTITKGAKLSTVKILPVKLICPLTGEEITTGKFAWKTTSTKVNESGYYPAKVTATGFETIEVYIYVKITGDESEPPISEFPTIGSVTYCEGLKAGDLELLGGKGIVDGHFEIADPDQELSAGNNTIGVIFIPDDSAQNQINISIVVKVEKATASFVDEEGNPIVPEVRYGIGDKFTVTNLKDSLKMRSANCGKFTVDSISTSLKLDGSYYDTSVPGEYNATAILNTQANTNYTGALKFKIIIEAKKVMPKVSGYGKDEYAVGGLNYTDKPQGTFDVYEEDQLIAKGVKINERFTWRPAKSGSYTLKAVYTPVVGDIYDVQVAESVVTLKLTWNINTENCAATPCQYGDTASVTQMLGENFGGWKFYDENGNEFVPEDLDDSVPSEVKFTMPDHEVTVKAIDKSQSNLPGDGLGCFSDFLAYLKNLIMRLLALFKAIANFVIFVG